MALKLHKTVGPGLLESTYKNALAFDLREAGFEVKQQVAMHFIYKDTAFAFLTSTLREILKLIISKILPNHAFQLRIWNCKLNSAFNIRCDFVGIVIKENSFPRKDIIGRKKKVIIF